MTELLHHDAGIDLHWTGVFAGTVSGASLYCVILVFLEQSFLDGGTRLVPHHLAAQCDSLTRRCGEMTARADRFAIATFNAGIGDVFDFWKGVRVLDVPERILIEHHAGSKQPSRIEELLDPPH